MVVVVVVVAAAWGMMALLVPMLGSETPMGTVTAVCDVVVVAVVVPTVGAGVGDWSA